MESKDICDQCLLAVGAVDGDSLIPGEKLTATRHTPNLWDGLALLQKSSTRVVWDWVGAWKVFQMRLSIVLQY